MLIEIPDAEIPAEHRDAIKSGRLLLGACVVAMKDGTPAIVTWSPDSSAPVSLGLAIGLLGLSLESLAGRVASNLDLTHRIAFEQARELARTQPSFASYTKITEIPVERKTDRSL